MGYKNIPIYTVNLIQMVRIWIKIPRHAGNILHDIFICTEFEEGSQPVRQQFGFEQVLWNKLALHFISLFQLKP